MKSCVITIRKEKSDYFNNKKFHTFVVAGYYDDDENIYDNDKKKIFNLKDINFN